MGPLFARFIQSCRSVLGPGTGLIFDCVNNWPVETVAKEPQDVVYIEVWPPHVEYRHLRTLIQRARELSGFSKQVVLAAYLEPFSDSEVPVVQAEVGARLAMASIFANGGFHLLLGEGTGILTDPYYPKFARARPDFTMILQRYYDFIVRYGDYLFDLEMQDVSEYVSGGINEELKIDDYPFGPQGHAGTIWTLVREKPGIKVLNLVNFININDMRWNEPKANEPDILENVTVTWLINEEIREIVYVSPDRLHGRPTPLQTERLAHPQGEALQFTLPELDVWGMVVVRLERGMMRSQVSCLGTHFESWQV